MEFLWSRVSLENEIMKVKINICFWALYYTLWKCQNFSVIQILREINFVECKSSKNAIFTILGALNFVDLVIFSIQKVQKYIKQKCIAFKCIEMADFAILPSPELISSNT